MRRREFIAGLGSTVAWPLNARAQQGERVRRIGVIGLGNENDPFAKLQLSTLTQALENLGWTDGHNVRMDFRWPGGDINRIRAFARELVGLQPDILLAGSTPATVALQRETRTIPIILVNVSDPVVSGIVAALNQPGGNITGFALLEASLGGKWLELLSEIVPGLKRATIMFNPDTAPSSVYMPSFETAARSLKVELITAPVHSDVEIETAIIGLGREPLSGLVVMPDSFLLEHPSHSSTIISAAARNNVPAVYTRSEHVREGGLLSYGVDLVDTWRRAAAYVDRILRGSKPRDLPVQFPTKYEMAVNLKTAKALGLTGPHRFCFAPTRLSNETPGVHCGARWRGCVAVGGAGAAARARAAHRRAHPDRRKRSAGEDFRLGVHPSACGLGLDRCPQRADGLSVARQ